MAKSLFIKRITPLHEAIVDWEILNPGGSMIECGKALKCTDTHISVVRNSDAFIAYRGNRLSKHQSIVSSSVVEKVEDLAKISLDEMNKRFNNPNVVNIPIDEVRDTSAMALKALGFGQQSQGRNNGNIQGAGGNVVVMIGANQEQLEKAREKLQAVNNNGEDNGESLKDITPLNEGNVEEKCPAVEIFTPTPT
jgi:hypothetical protein